MQFKGMEKVTFASLQSDNYQAMNPPKTYLQQYLQTAFWCFSSDTHNNCRYSVRREGFKALCGTQCMKCLLHLYKL